MLYRRKILLALLQLFEGQLDKIRLQKLLFLFIDRQSSPVYDFVPYFFGCYSFTANTDMTIMVTKGILEEDDTYFRKIDSFDYLQELKSDDRQLLQSVKSTFGKMGTKSLMKFTYVHYPFYAIKSKATEKILTGTELEKIHEAKPTNNQTTLFTIGYEGISLEEYFLRLLKNSINMLVDVRSNPISMKYGFSKNQLSRYCSNLDIYYVHIPEVGIQSVFRQNLTTQADYDRLFEKYRKTILSKTTEQQFQILFLLKQNQRIALTCFEANINHCHRKHLAEACEKLSGFKYEVKHI